MKISEAQNGEVHFSQLNLEETTFATKPTI